MRRCRAPPSWDQVPIKSTNKIRNNAHVSSQERDLHPQDGCCETRPGRTWRALRLPGAPLPPGQAGRAPIQAGRMGTVARCSCWWPSSWASRTWRSRGVPRRLSQPRLQLSNPLQRPCQLRPRPGQLRPQRHHQRRQHLIMRRFPVSGHTRTLLPGKIAYCLRPRPGQPGLTRKVRSRENEPGQLRREKPAANTHARCAVRQAQAGDAAQVTALLAELGTRTTRHRA